MWVCYVFISITSELNRIKNLILIKNVSFPFHSKANWWLQCNMPVLRNDQIFPCKYAIFLIFPIRYSCHSYTFQLINKKNWKSTICLDANFEPINFKNKTLFWLVRYIYAIAFNSFCRNSAKNMHIYYVLIFVLHFFRLHFYSELALLWNKFKVRKNFKFIDL